MGAAPRRGSRPAARVSRVMSTTGDPRRAVTSSAAPPHARASAVHHLSTGKQWQREKPAEPAASFPPFSECGEALPVGRPHPLGAVRPLHPASAAPAERYFTILQPRSRIELVVVDRPS